MPISFFEKSSEIPYRPKNVRIENIDTLPGESAQELFYASDVIGNYAKKHKVSVRFFDAGKLADDSDTISPVVEHKLSKFVGIDVTKNGKTNGTRVAYVSNDDKPFLRQVYEKIQILTEGKQPRLAKEKAKTMLKLINEGKVKA